MPTADRLSGWLAASWFAVLPACGLVVAAFVRERACADAYALLPGIAARPAAAYAIATAYVAGHVWLAVAYLVTVVRAGRLVPGPVDVVRVWGVQWYRPISLLAVLVLEQVPAGVWRLVWRGLGLC
jgi:hypothetical protein